MKCIQENVFQAITDWYYFVTPLLITYARIINSIICINYRGGKMSRAWKDDGNKYEVFELVERLCDSMIIIYYINVFIFFIFL